MKGRTSQSRMGLTRMKGGQPSLEGQNVSCPPALGSPRRVPSTTARTGVPSTSSWSRALNDPVYVARPSPNSASHRRTNSTISGNSSGCSK